MLLDNCVTYVPGCSRATYSEARISMLVQTTADFYGLIGEPVIQDKREAPYEQTAEIGMHNRPRFRHCFEQMKHVR